MASATEVRRCDAGSTALRGTVRTYDFRRPNKLSREQLQTLQIVHDTFAGQASTVLSSNLRAVTTITLDQVAEQTYDEYVRNLPNPTHLTLFSLQPLVGVSILQIPLSVALLIVDLMLGGQGRPVPERPLTDIEIALVRLVVERALADLAYAFEATVTVRPEHVGVESNPQFAQIVSPSDMVVVATLRISITADAHTEASQITVCYPYSMLHPVLDALGGPGRTSNRTVPVDVVRRALAARLQDTPVELAIRLDGPSLTGAEVMSLRVGDLLHLPHRVDRPLRAQAGDVDVLLVEPARSGSRLAARVVARTPNPAESSGWTPPPT